jgi:outer membrane lipoprotein-sorting protein
MTMILKNVSPLSVWPQWARLAQALGLAVLAMAACALPPSKARAADAAEPTADAILKRMDDEYNKFKDLEVLMKITLRQGGAVQKQIEARTYQLGGDKRMIRMLAPGNIKGMSVLIEDKDNTYVYLPDMGKVRRVAAHNTKGTFLGTDFTEQEMSILRYGDFFDAAVTESTPTQWVLKLTPKVGREFDFATIKLYVEKKSNLFSKLEYFGADGTKTKTQTRGELKELNGVSIQSKIEMIDHLKGSATEMAFEDIKVNQGLDPKFFTRRNLEWGSK